MTTNKGLIVYNTHTKERNLLTTEDGLSTNDLIYSHFYIKDNLLYLGSIKGLNVLHIDNIKFNKISPQVILAKFSVYDKEVILAKNNANENFDYTIKLPYNENYFVTEFASTNLIKPLKNLYRYKLDGFDKDWKYTQVPIARYMNIEPGKYTLIMYATNNDGLWSKKPLRMEIIISPPFWKTWWAYLIYFFLFILILYITIKIIVERQLHRNSEKEYEKKIKFFTQVSHEIRTPLTLITIPIEEIINESQNNATLLSKAKRLQKNANKLLNIVNELLDFKKIDDGHETLTLQEVNPKTYLEEFFYLFSDLALAKKLNFYIKNIQTTSNILIDPKHFDKALFNVFSNAIKYSTDGGTVFLEVKEDSKNVIIEIADNGIGISENNQFKIFEEYYRDPKAQDTIGTGIGLALTKNIIQQHKGEIICDTSKIGHETFTYFVITIPKHSKSADENTNLIPQNIQQQLIAKTSHRETLLLVEDNKELNESIANIFADHYNIIKAYNGEDGMKLAVKNLPDIILTDLMMPNMNGLEMTEKLKNNEITSHIPIVMLTADTNETSKVSGLTFGATVYLEKPFNSTVLSFTIKNLLHIASKTRKEFDINTQKFESEIDRNFILKIENIIDDNILNETFGVDFLSKEIGMSQPILYKKLKAITDLSVNNYIKQYRFKKSLKLFKTNLNISEVAYAVGFSDRKYFSKEFKKYYGITPTEYLEQQLKE